MIDAEDSGAELIERLAGLRDLGVSGQASDEERAKLRTWAALDVRGHLTRGYDYPWAKAAPPHGPGTGAETLLRAYAVWALDRVEPRAAGAPTVAYHVAAEQPNADDANDGSAERPLRTIQAAGDRARAGDTVVVHAGTYRERVCPMRTGEADRPITFAAAEGDAPAVAACDAWDVEWREEGDGVWSAEYRPLPWDAPPMATSNCEQVFVDGELLPHVETLDELRATPGAMTKAIDEGAVTGRIFIHLDGGDPKERLVERSVRQQCLAPIVRGLGHIHVRGLRMLGAAAPRWHGPNWKQINQRAVLDVANGHHWLIEDCIVEWGNAQGMQVAAGGFSDDLRFRPAVWPESGEPGGWGEGLKRCEEDTIDESLMRRNAIRGCTVRHHGIAGLVGIGCATGIVIDDNVFEGNCRIPGNRGTAEEGAIKIHGMEHNLIRHNLIRDNLCKGVWIESGSHHTRFTGNILINNAQQRIMVENNPGPNLIDNNVVLDGGPRAANDHGFGFYVHTGNRTTVINNVIVGQPTGTRVRALFHWEMVKGVPSTTSGHKIWNNLIANQRDHGLTLMPTVPRCEENEGNHNLLWNHGRPVRCMVENTGDVGLRWETTEVGRRRRLTGGGNLEVTTAEWAGLFGHDDDNLPVPLAAILAEASPERMRDMLEAAWQRRGLDLDGGYFEPEPVSTKEFLGLLRPELAGCGLLHHWQLSPKSGVQAWRTPDGPRQLTFRGDEIGAFEALPDDALAGDGSEHEPMAMTLSDERRVALGAGWRVAAAGLPAEIDGEELVIRVPHEAANGPYGVLVAGPGGRRYVPVNVSPPLAIREVAARRTPADRAVVVTLANNGGQSLAAAIEVRIGDETRTAQVTLAPRSTEAHAVPVAFADAGEAHVTVRAAGSTLTESKLLSLAAAGRTDDWADTERYGMDEFPGGLYPEGAFDYVFYQGNLHAGWRARYGDDGLHLRIEVEHTHHLCEHDLDMERIHTGDGVKLGVKGRPGDKLAVIGMALHSGTHEQSCGFFKVANEDRYTKGRCEDVMRASIRREGKLTAYDVLVAWDMINLDGPPPPGTPLPFSVMVSCRDPSAVYGLQWFYGIKYGPLEGREDAMGQLWLV